LGNIIDSSGALELIIFLQEHFGIIVEDREIGVPDNFGTLRGIVAFVSKKLHAVENT
jgi:acyl carrier protein